MMATKKERDLILEMLASGCITSDEARRLFDAVERCVQIDIESEFLSPLYDEVEVVPESVRAGIRGINEGIMHAVVFEM